MFLFIIVLFTSCNVKEESLVILPKGFTGYVLLIYDQIDGEDKEYIDKKRVYRIPEKGILKTKFQAEYGVSFYPEIYFEGNNNDRIKIIDNWDKYSEKNINVSLFSTGKSYINDNKKEVEYTVFFVGTKEEIEKSSKEFNKIHLADLINY